MHTTNYIVAGHGFKILHTEDDISQLMPSYEPFRTESEITPLFTLTIDDTLIPSWQGKRLGYFPCNSANFEVYRNGDSAYQILILDESDVPCTFVQSDEQMKNITIATRGNQAMRSFGLNNAIMLAYTYTAAPHKTLLMHSSVVENSERGYMFLGASGRGKSTHSDLWVKHIEGSTLINDDNPVVRISDDGTPIVYGSPWSGKRPIYKNVHYPIGGLTAIEQGPANSIRREAIPTAFGIMLSSCSTMKFDKRIHILICHTITNVLEKLAVHTLTCRPDKEAAIISSNTLKA